MKKNREIICGLTAWVLTVCFFLSCLLIPGLSERISAHGNINILVYGMTLVLFCILFLAGMAWSTSRRNNSQGLTESPVAKKTALVILLGSQLPFWIVCVTRETEQVGTVSMKYGWHTQLLAVMILLFLAELAVFFWLYENLSLTEKKGEWIIWLTYAALVILIFYCMYTPNIYGRGEQGDNYHAHAYFNSVYNVYQGVPYTHNVTSIYGHYGLFFKIPMKLVHGDFRAFVLMMAGLGALTYIGAFLVLQMLVRSRILRVVAAFALAFPVLGMRGGYYWQVWPHRVLFPVLLLLYGTVILKKKRSNLLTATGGYLICLLAILWNTETGLLLTVSWAGLYISRLLSRKKWKIRELFFSIGAQAGGMIFAFAGAYGIVNLYNLSKHSPMNSVRDFLIPLLSDGYMTDTLHLDLPTYPSAYMAVITLFLTGVAMGIAGWFGDREKRRWETDLIFMLSVGALGCLVYYMNRPSYHNLDCISISAVLLAAYLAQHGLDFVKKNGWKNIARTTFYEVVRGGIGIICAASVLAMGTGTILQFSQNSKIKENFHNTAEFEDFAQQVAAVVPANTHGFGLNVAEVYSMLHWSTQCFTMDFSDMAVRPDSLKELKEQLETEDAPAVFTNKSSLGIWKRNDPATYQWFCDNYKLNETFPFYNEEFRYFTKR